MLRGLWLAVAILGAIVQLGPKLLETPAYELPGTLFAMALSAAVLYTVGAAATTFSVEHEEETYDFLTRLPARWWPLFAAKLLVTVITAVLLTTTLSITGWALCGFKSVSGPDARSLLGMLGFAIFEALAWGTLFSLLIKRPLLAAIVTLVTGIVVVNVAVNVVGKYSVASITPEAYVEAIPLRLAIVAVVLACCVATARGWLNAGGRPAVSGSALGAAWSRLRGNEIEAAPRSGRRSMARLLWQTWRECWKLLVVPLLLGLLFLMGISAAVGLSSEHLLGLSEYIVGSTLLFVPALYGAMAFYCDQRRNHYRFLAEHAARPRHIWFARNAVWLGSLAVVVTSLTGMCLALASTILRRTTWESFENYILWGYFPTYTSAGDIVYQISRGTEFGMRIVILGSFGALVAYGLGQLCSMVVRSEIMAAFLALLLSCVVTAWVAILFAWQLSGCLFLLPLFLGFMLATWLRAGLDCGAKLSARVAEAGVGGCGATALGRCRVTVGTTRTTARDGSPSIGPNDRRR